MNVYVLKLFLSCPLPLVLLSWLALRFCYKLSLYGIRGSLLLWIKNFLTGRTQQVVVNGHISGHTEVTSGVPQGSIITPLLFLLYINNLPDDIPYVGKFWRIWRTVGNSPKFSPPIFIFTRIFNILPTDLPNFSSPKTLEPLICQIFPPPKFSHVQ